jgi:hypothetical protein
MYVELNDLDRAQAWYDRAAELAGSESLATLFRRHVELVVNRDDGAALTRIVDGLSSEEFFGAGLSPISDLGGDLHAIRSLYEQTWPELAAVRQRSVSFTNTSSALVVLWLLQQEGDLVRARAMIDRISRVLDQLPPNGLLGTMPGEPKDSLQARLFALEGREDDALRGLLSMEGAGLWPNLSPKSPDPLLKGIRDRPEFQALIERIRARLADELALVIEMEQKGELEPMRAAAVLP